jgi:hypothetical protein
MKNKSNIFPVLVVLIIVLNLFPGCKKPVNPIKFPVGTFPDSVYNLTSLNSPYDDYNSNISVLQGYIPILFSSNRVSSGGQFDLVQGSLTFLFDQKTGAFSLNSSLSTDPFYSALINKAVTPGNDFGPYSMFSKSDGYEYLFLASQSAVDPLDLFYLKYLPRNGNNIPVITGPYPVKLLNTTYDDAYISFDINEDSAYFTSNRGGNFDIYLHKKPGTIAMDSWLNQNFASSVLADSVNSSYDDKCPYVYKNVMVFTSNRPGGMGGYDLYYSVFKKGKWSSPVNMGPTINTASDEYRPVLNSHPEFNNMFLVFSSNKPGGSGGFDLYFTGFTVPKTYN